MLRNPCRSASWGTKQEEEMKRGTLGVSGATGKYLTLELIFGFFFRNLLIPSHSLTDPTFLGDCMQETALGCCPGA